MSVCLIIKKFHVLRIMNTILKSKMQEGIFFCHRKTLAAKNAKGREEGREGKKEVERVRG